MKATKQVAYAYPSSDTAGRLGFGKTGCYFFRLALPRGGWPITVKSSAQRDG